jgi:hypothetical protein
MRVNKPRLELAHPARRRAALALIAPAAEKINPLARSSSKRRRPPLGKLRFPYWTAFFSSAPALNFGTDLAAIWIVSPLLGLRP